MSLGTEELMGHASVNLEELKEIPLHSYYYENVFSLEDLHLFRAVFSFYKGDYVAAIRDYEICQNLKYDGETKE